MEKISKDEVKHLAELSSISLSEEEISNLQTDLGNIVEYIEQLGELNTDGVEPTYSVSKNQNVWREDEIDDYGVKRDELLKLAGENIEDNQVKVPNLEIKLQLSLLKKLFRRQKMLKNSMLLRA